MRINVHARSRLKGNFTLKRAASFSKPSGVITREIFKYGAGTAFLFESSRIFGADISPLHACVAKRNVIGKAKIKTGIFMLFDIFIKPRAHIVKTAVPL